MFHLYQRAPYGVKQALVRVAAVPRFLAKPFIKGVHVGGCNMRLNPSDNAAFRYWNYRGRYEAGTTDTILKLISANPGCCFLDIGAGYGAYTWSVASIGRYGTVKKIFAFEPDRTCYRTLLESRKANDLVGFVEIANVIVGDYNGTAKFLKSARASTSNRTFDSSSGSLRFSGQTEMPCATIDQYLQDQGIHVSSERFVIKIDVEGNELRVLRGMNGLLKRSAGYAVLFEYWPIGIREVGLDPAELGGFIGTLKPEVALSENSDSGFHRLGSIEDLRQEMHSLTNSATPISAVGNFLIADRLRVPSA